VDVTPERWQHVARIYESAIEVDPDSRDDFLSTACGGDEALRREVESLLRQDDASVILDRPVWVTAAPLLNDGPALDPGVSLGPYRIEHLLGAGGMGRVFRASDTRLGRLVAIKVLASGVAFDQQMRARFGREARAVAALAHPHICTLYDVGSHDHFDYLVMEYLEARSGASPRHHPSRSETRQYHADVRRSEAAGFWARETSTPRGRRRNGVGRDARRHDRPNVWTEGLRKH
jgi:serine/threonine protein kinase